MYRNIWPTIQDLTQPILFRYSGTGTAVESSSILEIRDPLLDLALQPYQECTTDKQTIHPLVLAIATGADLTSTQTGHLKGVDQPTLLLRVAQSGTRRCKSHGLVEFCQTSGRESARMERFILTWV